MTSSRESNRWWAGVGAAALIAAGLQMGTAQATTLNGFTQGPVNDTVTTQDLDAAAYSFVVNAKQADATGTEAAKTAISKAGGKVVQPWPQIGVVIAHAPSRNFADTLRRDPAILSVGWSRTKTVDSRSADENRSANEVNAAFEKKMGITSTKVRRDPREAPQWDMQHINADKQSGGKSSVTVAVVDSGIDGSHPDLRSQIDVSRSVGCQDKGIPNPSTWGYTSVDHGTHVAGTIGAAKNGTGIVGVASQTKMISVKVVDEQGNIYPEYAICGFVWLAEHNVQVANHSYFVDPWNFLCASDPDQGPLREGVNRAVQYSHSKGVINVAASGNENLDLANKTTDKNSPSDGTKKPRPIDATCLDAPSELDGVVTVSSTDKQKRLSSFSNYGLNKIDVASPGSDILSTVPGSEWSEKSGTSMASPHVAGVLAVMVSANPGISQPDAVAKLRSQANSMACPSGSRNCKGPAEDNGFFGRGMADALKASRP